MIYDRVWHRPGPTENGPMIHFWVPTHQLRTTNLKYLIALQKMERLSEFQKLNADFKICSFEKLHYITLLFIHIFIVASSRSHALINICHLDVVLADFFFLYFQ